MKTAIAILISLSLVVVLGCESPRGGGISGGEGFKIGTPTFTTEITQGETESVPISLNRGEYFKRDVMLELKASEGIGVEPAEILIKGSDQPDASIRISAARDANLGEYKVFIKGTPETGESTSTEITVRVVGP